MPRPNIIDPAVTISGFILPIPSNRLQVVIPLDENGATLVRLWSNEPTPTTLVKSPGLLRVP